MTALLHQVCCRSAKGFVSVSMHKYASSLLAVSHHARCCIVSQSTTKEFVVAWLYASHAALNRLLYLQATAIGILQQMLTSDDSAGGVSEVQRPVSPVLFSTRAGCFFCLVSCAFYVSPFLFLPCQLVPNSASSALVARCLVSFFFCPVN